MTSNHINILLWLSILIPANLCIATQLSGTYSSNFTFTVAGSPYNVTNAYGVIFESTSHVIIENGAQIGFVKNAHIIVKGSINIGCYDGVINRNIDTALFKNSGLADNTTYTHLYSIDGGFGSGIQITGNSTKDTQICNTKFSNIQYGIIFRFSPHSNLLIDNCVFDGLYSAVIGSLDSYANYDAKMTDSFITRTENVIIRGGMIFDNIQVNQMKQFNGYSYAGYSARMTVINSRFSNCVDSMDMLCGVQFEGYYGDGSNAFVNNTFFNVSNPVRISESELNAGLVIRDNIFESGSSSYDNTLEIFGSNISIINNTFYHNSGYYGIMFDSNNTLIANNTFIDNDFEIAIATRPSTDHNLSYITIIKNEFVNNGIDNMANLLWFSQHRIDNVHIEYNTFINNTMRGNVIGIINNGHPTVISNNQFIDNYIKANSFWYRESLISVDANDVYYENNLFENNIINNSEQLIYQKSGDMVFFQHNTLINNWLITTRYASIFRMDVGESNVAQLSIKYNSFKSNGSISNMAEISNYTYIYIWGYPPNIKSIIQYNNFDDNDKLLYFVDGVFGNITLTNNYFGSGCIEPFSIDNKLHDSCDVGYNTEEYSNIAFSPWYYEAIDFNDLSNLPSECSFTAFFCNVDYYNYSITYYNYICGDCITFNPSMAPTSPTSTQIQDVTQSTTQYTNQSGLDCVISIAYFIVSHILFIMVFI